MSEYGVPEGDTVRFRRVLPGPLQRVWEYLTESEKRGRWLAAGEMELRVGGRVVLSFRHSELSPAREATPERYAPYADGATMEGRVTACDPPRLLSYTWAEESDGESEVTFELSPQGDQVLLVLTHRRLRDPRAMLSVASGWHTHLDVLADRLAGRTSRPYWSAHAEHEAEYERLVQHDSSSPEVG
jgi:uncharacterized protein YndB with AHSA1/START domain